jgi:hypothetical protein
VPAARPIRVRSAEDLHQVSAIDSDAVLGITPRYTPKRIKQEELRSALQPLAEYVARPAEQLSLRLTNLPKNFDRVDLKKLCEGLHVVSSEFDYDPLTGEYKAAVNLNLRVNNDASLKQFECRLVGEGIESRQRSRSNVVKSKYWDLPNAPLAEFRTGRSREVDARTAKLQEQTSSIFYKPRKFTPVRVERDNAFQSQMQWKKTRNAKKDNF